MSKQYGVGTYRAKIIAKGVILISARGQTPYSNIKPGLAELPWRIFPPHFGLFFESTGDIGAAVMTPFATYLVAEYPSDQTVVNVVDSTGVNRVGIDEVSIDRVVRFGDFIDAGPGYAVYQQLNNPGNCLVAPTDAIVPAIYFNATAYMGPLTLADAEAWKSSNCAKAPSF